MKNILKIVISVLAIGLLGYFGYGIYAKIQQKNDIAERIEQIPDFSFQTLRGQEFGQGDIMNKTSKIFIYFNSECDFCQEEAKEIEKSLIGFKDVELFFISSETPKKIKIFSDNYNLSDYDNTYFLHDPRGDFARLFGASTVPYSLVYNEKNKLITTFNGFVKAENLLKALP